MLDDKCLYLLAIFLAPFSLILVDGINLAVLICSNCLKGYGFSGLPVGLKNCTDGLQHLLCHLLSVVVES